jgi:hypothetical protein
MDELQKIYDSEINVSFSWLWDGGIDVKLGDEMNGFVAEANVKLVSAVVPWLQESIAKHFPHSAYNLDRLRHSGDKVVKFPGVP